MQHNVVQVQLSAVRILSFISLRHLNNVFVWLHNDNLQ